LLWASTGTKNKEYRDVLYVEELIGFQHGQYRATGDARRLPRSRQSHATALRKTSRKPGRVLADLEKIRHLA